MDAKISTSRKSLILMAAGVVVMFIGYILLSGGGVTEPGLFNWDMFDTRRLVVAPLVILAGLITEVVAIMGVVKEKKQD